MSLAIRARFEPLRTLGFAAIGAAYMGVGTSLGNPISRPFRLVFTASGASFGYRAVCWANSSNPVTLYEFVVCSL